MEQRKDGESKFVKPLETRLVRKSLVGQTLTKIMESSMKLTPRPVRITIPARLQLANAKVLTSKNVELIEKKTELEKSPQKQEPNPSGVEYTFDPAGRLIYNKNVYRRVSISGNCIRYRCSEHQKKKCPATLKTIGKEAVLLVKEHNHDNKLK